MDEKGKDKKQEKRGERGSGGNKGVGERREKTRIMSTLMVLYI